MMDRVAKWLKNECIKWKKNDVNSRSFEEYLYGYFDFNNSFVNQSTGSVYGIWIKITTQESYDNLIKDLNKSSKKIISSKVDAIFSDESGTWYPLYWGKDINPGSRIRAHFRTGNGTGGLDLSRQKFLHNYEMKWGNILVRDYDSFENYLHKTYPPILGTSCRGRISKWINILY